jgi:hypothetical protein
LFLERLYSLQLRHTPCMVSPSDQIVISFIRIILIIIIKIIKPFSVGILIYLQSKPFFLLEFEFRLSYNQNNNWADIFRYLSTLRRLYLLFMYFSKDLQYVIIVNVAISVPRWYYTRFVCRRSGFNFRQSQR